MAPTRISQITQASGELALDLAAPADWLPFATACLREVVGLVHPKDRGQFLFQCWERWTNRLTPQDRVRLLERAREHSGEVPHEPQLTGQAARAWRRYRLAIRRCNVEALPGGTPPHYLLFEQIHLVHEQLAVDLPARAMATVIVRAELSAGAR